MSDLVERLRGQKVMDPARGLMCSPTREEEEAADRIEELEGIVREAQAFRLEAQSREAEEARFYRYLRDEAGTGDDDDGPMICSGLGDNFDYLRGEECDAEIRAAIERKARAHLTTSP